MIGVAACDSAGLDAGYAVTYSVTATGENTISALSYRDARGALATVANPVLPWSRTVAMRSGDEAWLSVDGTSMSGTFEATLRAATEDNVINLNTACVTGTDEVYPKTCDDLSVEHRLP